MSNWLVNADKKLLYLINSKWSFNGLNPLMLLAREAITWVPLYLFFLLFFYLNCKKYIVPIVIFTLLTFAITDYTSASILKPLIGRLRPCQDPTLLFQLKSITACGGLFSMPSSHAANHFGLATFWYMVIKETLHLKWTWLFVWAFVICYAQVYVGVHYPLDVVAGAALGLFIGAITGTLYKRRISLTLSYDSNKI